MRSRMLVMAVRAACQSTWPSAPGHSGLKILLTNKHAIATNKQINKGAKKQVNPAALIISAHISVFCFYALIFNFLQLFLKSDLHEVNY